ncbi:MAG: ROK family protein [Nitrospirota bacterium]
MQKRYAIGIDIGGTNLRIALVSNEGIVIEKIKKPTSEGIIESISEAINKLLSADIKNDIAGIGIGVAGLIDRKNDRVLVSPNIHDLEKIDLVTEIKKNFDVAVTIENDANVAAFGEKWVGAGKNLSDFVLFTLGTGIGCGIIYNKRLLKVPAEVGHMSINVDGEKCLCGNLGCLESYASARAILSKAVSLLEKGRESSLKDYCGGNFYKLAAEDLYKAALDGDGLSREVLKDAGRYLGIGVANIINLMGPDAVILAGGLIGAWDIYVQEAIREASRRAFKELFTKVKIIPSLLADDAGAIGSAGLIFQRRKQT